MQTYNPAVSHKRKERDITKLLMSNYKVQQNQETPFTFKVEIEGPVDSVYSGGVWTLNVHLPDQYPYKSPSIGFLNRMYHPNVDEASGTVCLDVINQAWSPMFDLINVIEVFIPQLLQYPNPNDPLNPEAASLLLKDKSKYEKKVNEMVSKYARKPDFEKKTTIENLEFVKANNESTKSNNIVLQSYKKKDTNSNDQIEEEKISNISLSDVSELSQHSFDHNDIMKQF